MKSPRNSLLIPFHRALTLASVSAALLPSARAQDTARNPWRQPYQSTSIWNTPLGSGASPRSITVSPNGIGRMEGDVTYLYLYNPGDPERHIYYPGGGGFFTTRLPDSFLPDASYGFTPNNCASFISPDSYGLELQPFNRSGNGADISAYNFSYNNNAFFSILGDGLYGSHFGSGLPAEGGCLRVDELTGSGNIRHALQIELPTYRLYKDTGAPNDNHSQTYRWPANRSDDNIDDYGTQNTSNADLRMGALLTMSANVTESSLGLTTPAAKKLFWTLSNYGAYIVDTSATSSDQPNGADAINFGIEAGAKLQFRNAFGYEFATYADDNSAWFRDINAIYKNLVVVSNNGPANVGGGGTSKDPTRLTALAYGVRKDVNNGTQIEAEDYNVGGQDTGYHDDENGQFGRPNSAYSSRDGGDGYRNDGVDIYPTADPDGCAPGYWAVGWTDSGEWLKYDLNVTSAGTYTITVRAASGGSGGSLHFEDENGNTLGGVINVPGTGGWDTFNNYTTASFSLSAGNHTIRLVENTGGYNVNYFRFATASSSSPLTNGSIYEIEAQIAPGKGLDVKDVNTADFTPVQTYTYGGGNNQRWTAIDAGNGYWEFAPVFASGERLDVNGSGGSGTGVQIYHSNSTPAQRWKLIANGDGSYDLSPQYSTDNSLRLDVSGSNAGNGGVVQVYTTNGTTAQHWKFIAR